MRRSFAGECAGSDFQRERRVQKRWYYLLLAVIAAATALAAAAPAVAQINSLHAKGFNYVSYYNGGYANADSLPALVGTGANAVALSFEYGIDVQNSAVYADPNYTESQSVIAATIAEAKSRGLSVMVRPLLDFLDPAKIGSYSVGDWRSTYNPTDVAAFFASYKTMIVGVAQLAQANGATGLSIGAELDQLTGPAYQSYWTDIIASVRTVFSGTLTYSSVWSDAISPWQGQHGLPAGTGNPATQVSFWAALDYLGIDCYAPLSDAANPTVAQLTAGWTQTPSNPTSLSVTGHQSLISYFSAVATAAGKPLVFTELGYESASDAARQPSGTSTNVYDPTLQANLYTAFFNAWQQNGNNALTGVYFWNWDPNVAEVGPGNGPNFSPQEEPAQAVITANFTAQLGALSVTPSTGIASSGTQGGPFSPASFAYQLQATSGSVGFSIAGVPSWLTASSTSGTVSTSATTVTFTVNANANALSPTTYTATITFTDTTNNDTAQTTSATLTVNAPVPVTYPLSVAVSGSGTVTDSSGAIACGSICSADFSSGIVVTLTATPAGGASFAGWGGACNGIGSCQITMNSLESVTAMFSSPGGSSSPTSRTWVSAALGSDSNPCTRGAPCLTFAAALALTTAGGEIDVLDPGDFGPLTITQSVTIAGDEANPSGILTASGTSGIVINAGAGDVINLRGIVFDGANVSGTSGVVFNSGARLQVKNCVFEGFTASGLTLSPGAGSASPTRIFVRDTLVVGNAAGIVIKPTGAIAAIVDLRWLSIDQNGGEALRVDGTGGSGAITTAIADSAMSLNGSNAVDAVSGPGSVSVGIMRLVASRNGAGGIVSNQSNGGAASVTVGSSLISGNVIAAQAIGGASLLSYGNNQVTGNGTNGSFTGSAGLQ
jgi:Divergent InlB B-repeat domain